MYICIYVPTYYTVLRTVRYCVLVLYGTAYFSLARPLRLICQKNFARSPPEDARV